MSVKEFVSEAAVLDALNGGIIVLDSQRRIVCWNKWMVSAAGLSAEEACGKLLTEVFRDSDFRRLSLAIGTALTSGASTILTHGLNPSLLPLRTRSGQPLFHDVTISPVGSHSSNGCVVFVTDVTMATKREKYLRDQQDARYDAVVESAPDVILTLDADGFIQLANPAAVSQFGYSMSELTGREAAGLFESADRWASMWRSATDGTVINNGPREVIAKRKDGSLSYLEASASSWQIGSRLFVTIILRDINRRRAIDAALRTSEEQARTAAKALADLNQTLEQRVEERTAQLMKAEEALRQSQKMEAIGQLTGGIAHDFNNLLQGISGALSLLQKRVAAGRIGEIDRFITGALESSKRAASLTHRLLAFSRQQPIDPRPVNENQLISSIEELLRRTIGETLQLKFVPAEDLWLVRCDANQLENAILNLVINARDAMPNGGTLTIETCNKVLNATQAATRELKRGEYVMLRITDTGIGMSPEVQTRAFDPFFTTKPIGKGTGLGLSMIYGFVKQSDGSIYIQSEAGKGTSIEICLPRYSGEVLSEPVVQANEQDEHAVSGEVVLVVEDEGIVRLLVVEVLKELGYYALEADTGASAIRILESPQRIDLLVTDIGLPDISGRQVADIGRQHRKNLKVLLMTGYAEKAAGNFFLDAGFEILMKPFAIDVLNGRIREMIERK